MSFSIKFWYKIYQIKLPQFNKFHQNPSQRYQDMSKKNLDVWGIEIKYHYTYNSNTLHFLWKFSDINFYPFPQLTLSLLTIFGCASPSPLAIFEHEVVRLCFDIALKSQKSRSKYNKKMHISFINNCDGSNNSNVPLHANLVRSLNFPNKIVCYATIYCCVVRNDKFSSQQYIVAS